MWGVTKAVWLDCWKFCDGSDIVLFIAVAISPTKNKNNGICGSNGKKKIKQSICGQWCCQKYVAMKFRAVYRLQNTKTIEVKRQSWHCCTAFSLASQFQKVMVAPFPITIASRKWQCSWHWCDYKSKTIIYNFHVPKNKIKKVILESVGCSVPLFAFPSFSTLWKKVSKKEALVLHCCLESDIIALA